MTSDLFSGGGATRGVLTGGGSTRGGESTPLLEEQYRENQKEEKHTQVASPTQESCVCETEQLNLEKPTPEKSSLEEPTPQQPASLSKNSEYEQQTNNPSCRPTIAAESFDKSEQSNIEEGEQGSFHPPSALAQRDEVRSIPPETPSSCPANSPLPRASYDPYKTSQNVKDLIDAWLTDPTAFADDCVPLLVRDSIKWNRWVLPWHSGERKLNNFYQNFNPIVVDFLAAELASKSKLSAQQEITHAVAVMNTWEKTKAGWTNLMQRYQQAVLQTEKQSLPQLHNAPMKRPSNTTSTTLEDALAQDHKRRQQEQSKPQPSLEYQKSPEMLELKAKLQAKANEPKVPSNTRPSSMNLREVEAQLKLALRA